MFSKLLFWKPVAITVTSMRSLYASSMVAPKMVLACGSTTSFTNFTASFTSSRVKSRPPVTLIITDCAPSMVVSNNGLATASRTASMLLFSPVPLPIPMCAIPRFFITVRTSAKSRLIKEGVAIRSEIP